MLTSGNSISIYLVQPVLYTYNLEMVFLLRIAMETHHEKPLDFPLLGTFFEECEENKESYLRETCNYRFFLDDEHLTKTAFELPLVCNQTTVSRKLTYLQVTKDWSTRNPILTLLTPVISLMDDLLKQGDPLAGQAAPNKYLANKIRQRLASAIMTTLTPSKEKSAFLNNSEILHHTLAEEHYTAGHDSCAQAQKTALQEANICAARHFWSIFLSDDPNTLAQWLENNNLTSEEQRWFKKYHQLLCKNPSIDAEKIAHGLRALLIQRDADFKEIITVRRKVYCASSDARREPSPDAIAKICEYIPLKTIFEQFLEQTKSPRHSSEKSFFSHESSSDADDISQKKRFCALLSCSFVLDPTVSELHIASQHTLSHIQTQNPLFIHMMLVKHCDALGSLLQKAFEKGLEKKMHFASKSMHPHLEKIKTLLNNAIAMTKEEEKNTKVVRFTEDTLRIP